ncbi:MAG: hypothetical protein AB7N91_32670 [Candidatus Tectimicrobiota bacterium]
MARPPRTFNEFVGQKRVMTSLTRRIMGAKALATPWPSLRLAAPAGAGKTTFAAARAPAYGSTLHELHAREATRTPDICSHL